MHELDLYQSEALQTAVYPLERGLEYTVLGLLSEVGELAEVCIDANYDQGAGRKWAMTHVDSAVSELSDNFWYCAAIADALGTTLGQITEAHPPEDVYLSGSRGMVTVFLVREAGAIAGIVKKAIRDNNGVLAKGKQHEIEHHLLRVLALLEHLALLLGTTGARARRANILKLADRKERGTLQGSGNHR